MVRWGGAARVLVLASALGVWSGCGGEKPPIAPPKPAAAAAAGGSAGLAEGALVPPAPPAPAGTSLAAVQSGKAPGEAAGSPLDDVHFAFDSFELDEAARRTLRGHAAWLEAHPQAVIEIEGHCDERGTIEYNLALGAKRAAAAKAYLVSLGVAARRLTTVSYGEELPLCHEHSEACWRRNRRAHFVVLAR